MKLLSTATLAALALCPSLASAALVSVDFEKAWEYGTEVRSYYAGGTASDGTGGPDVGVTFVNVAGLSNDADFTYYSGAPSSRGTAYAFTSAPGDRAYFNVAAGVGNALAFYYSSPIAIVGAVKAYSGLDGTGRLLGSIDLPANIGGATGYDVWSRASFAFLDIARSFDLTASANVVGFDNIAAVPEPGMLLTMAAGGIALVGMRRRRARR